MIRILLILAAMLGAMELGGCYACGNGTTDSEVTAQVKKVIKRTPLVCPDYVEVDVSLGVMRNGIGSMSHEDLVLRLMDESTLPALETAAKDGAIVTLRYDVARINVCYPDHKLKSWQVDIDPATDGDRTPDGTLTPQGYKKKIRSLDPPDDAGS